MKSVSGARNDAAAAVKNQRAAERSDELDQCNYNVVPTLRMDKQG